jgi:hypothetical protein
MAASSFDIVGRQFTSRLDVAPTAITATAREEAVPLFLRIAYRQG